MNLSKEDMFCEAQDTETTDSGATLTHASTNVLDFHQHGDDILHQLFWSLFVNGATNGSKLTVKWETSDYETFADSTGTASKTELFSKEIAAASLTKGAYPIQNEVLPRGLKRYNRLTFTVEASKTDYPLVSAFLHDGRVEGQPLTGL